MKILNVDIELPKSLSEAEVKSIAEVGKVAVFGSLLINAVNSIYGEGKIPMTQGKILASIQDRVDASSSEDLELEVEDGQYDFIKTVFFNDKVTFHAMQYQIVSRFLDKLF